MIPEYELDTQSEVPCTKLPLLQQSVDPLTFIHSLPSPHRQPDGRLHCTAIPNSTTTTHIWTEYHPKSGRPIRTIPIDDPSCDTSLTSQPRLDPWSPFFTTHEDFLVSEILLEAAVGGELADRLLASFQLCRAGKGMVMFLKFSQVQTAWEHALVQLASMSPGPTIRTKGSSSVTL